MNVNNEMTDRLNSVRVLVLFMLAWLSGYFIMTKPLVILV